MCCHRERCRPQPIESAPFSVPWWRPPWGCRRACCSARARRRPPTRGPTPRPRGLGQRTRPIPRWGPSQARSRPPRAARPRASREGARRTAPRRARRWRAAARRARPRAPRQRSGARFPRLVRLGPGTTLRPRGSRGHQRRASPRRSCPRWPRLRGARTGVASMRRRPFGSAASQGEVGEPNAARTSGSATAGDGRLAPRLFLLARVGLVVMAFRLMSSAPHRARSVLRAVVAPVLREGDDATEKPWSLAPSVALASVAVSLAVSACGTAPAEPPLRPGPPATHYHRAKPGPPPTRYARPSPSADPAAWSGDEPAPAPPAPAPPAPSAKPASSGLATSRSRQATSASRRTHRRGVDASQALWLGRSEG